MAALPPGRLDGLLFCVAQGTVVFSISVQAYYWCSMRSAYPAFNIACCPDPRLLVGTLWSQEPWPGAACWEVHHESRTLSLSHETSCQEEQRPRPRVAMYLDCAASAHLDGSTDACGETCSVTGGAHMCVRPAAQELETCVASLEELAVLAEALDFVAIIHGGRGSQGEARKKERYALSHLGKSTVLGNFS